MAQSETGPDKQPDPPSLAKNTWADKGMRFGCGAALGSLIATSIAINAEGPGLGAMMILGLIIMGLCGTLGMTHGERFFERLLRTIKWLG